MLNEIANLDTKGYLAENFSDKIKAGMAKRARKFIAEYLRNKDSAQTGQVK
jgi:hypothetical protein